jgi:hypothetical protein
LIVRPIDAPNIFGALQHGMETREMVHQGTVGPVMTSVPYAIGLFMLVPYIAWMLMWWLVFPGTKNGFGEPVGPALLAVTTPLAAWFFLRSLNSISASMATHNRGSRIIARGPMRLIPLLPYASLLLSIGGVALLVRQGEPWYIVSLVIITGVAAAAAIFLGERERSWLGQSSSNGPQSSVTGSSVAQHPEADDPHLANRWFARLASVGAAILLVALVTDPVAVALGVALILTAVAFALIIFLLPAAV